MATSADVSQARELVVDLERISRDALKEVDAILKRGAQNIKDDLVAEAASSRSFRPIAPTITYDQRYGLGKVGYEIGPDKDRSPAASLANIAYFGGARGGGGTLDIDGPLEREKPQMMQHLAQYLGGIL